jgi:hypothetical protein
MTMPSDGLDGHCENRIELKAENDEGSRAIAGNPVPDHPQTIVDVIRLYYERYKPLYSRIQTFNEMPVELVFEVAAAWDHLSRHWKYGEAEATSADRASRHIKRAIFDAFKLLLKHTVDEYDELCRLDLSIIDNGEFDRNLRVLVSEIRTDSIAARAAEGDTGNGDWHNAFALWDSVYQKMEQFEREFYLNSGVPWAKRKTAEFACKRRAEGFAFGVLASLAAWLISLLFTGWPK